MTHERGKAEDDEDDNRDHEPCWPFLDPSCQRMTIPYDLFVFLGEQDSEGDDEYEDEVPLCEK